MLSLYTTVGACQSAMRQAEQAGPSSAGVAAEGDGSGGTDLANARARRLEELRLKINESRKANQGAVIREQKRENASRKTPDEGDDGGGAKDDGKRRRYEESKTRQQQMMASYGLEEDQAHMLQSAESASAQYKKQKKKPENFAWDMFNQKSLYNAYKKRTKNIDPSLAQDTPQQDLPYGVAPAVSAAAVDRMVQELADKKAREGRFSRRRTWKDKTDDGINDRNAHYNRKIERAFGKATEEIKQNLERGTAL